MAPPTNDITTINYGAIPDVDSDIEDPPEVSASAALERHDSNGSHHSHASHASIFESVKFDPTGGLSLQDVQGTATMFSEIVNIAKNLLGAGVLSMSGGIAMYSNEPWAVVTGTFWIVVQAILFGYFCILIAKVCHITDSLTIRACWERSMGPKGAVAVVTVIAMNPAQGTLAYSAILSQTFQSLCQTIGFEIPYVMSLLLITICALLPLCLLKNIHVLAPFSILGTLGVVFTAVCMIYRCVDGTYQEGGLYYNHLAPQYLPDFGTRNEAWTPKVLPLVCMIFEAYVMHYNSPRFYMELKDKTIPRFVGAVSGSFGLAATSYVLIASAGFLTFGGNSDTYILNNYSPYDPLATLCRLFIGVSVLTIYPIAFIGFRDGVLDVMNITAGRQTTRFLNTLTVVMLSLITLTAVFVTDLGMINAVGGGTIAIAMCFVFPAIMFRQAVKHLAQPKPSQLLEAKLVVVLMVAGVVMGLVGVWQEIAQSMAEA